jgi:lysozyme family protein
VADFTQAMAYLDADEGTYANDPRDLGGETYRGIARTKWPQWDGWVRVDALRTGLTFPQNLDADSTLQASVAQFYRKSFWRFDGVTDQAVANKIFDEGVNLGSGGLVKLLQQALRTVHNGVQIAIDGQYGPQTEALINSTDSDALMLELKVQLAMYYCKLANPTYLRGWLRRALR